MRGRDVGPKIPVKQTNVLPINLFFPLTETYRTEKIKIVKFTCWLCVYHFQLTA